MRFPIRFGRALLCALTTVAFMSAFAVTAWADGLLAAAQGVPVLGPYLPWMVLGGALCSVIASALPAPSTAAPLAWVIVYRLVNLAAFNFGHASNADDVAAAKRNGVPGIAVLLAGGLLLTACADGKLTPGGQAAVTAAVTLAGVAASQNSTVASLVTGGQLFCKGAGGIVALLKAGQQPTSVIGRSAGLVAEACADIGAIPVPPPPDPAATPVAVAPAKGL